MTLSLIFQIKAHLYKSWAKEIERPDRFENPRKHMIVLQNVSHFPSQMLQTPNYIAISLQYPNHPAQIESPHAAVADSPKVPGGCHIVASLPQSSSQSTLTAYHHTSPDACACTFPFSAPSRLAYPSRLLVLYCTSQSPPGISQLHNNH